MADGPVNGAGEKEGTGRNRVLSIGTTRQFRSMARPVELCMKSMVSTTGVGSGAGVGALSTISVTLSTLTLTRSRHKVAEKTRRSTELGPEQVNQGLRRRPAGAPTRRCLLPLPSRSPVKAAGVGERVRAGVRTSTAIASPSSRGERPVVRAARPADPRVERMELRPPLGRPYHGGAPDASAGGPVLSGRPQT